MFSKLKDLAKTPAFWVVLIVVAVAVASFSKLRKPFAEIGKKIPGSDAAPAS